MPDDLIDRLIKISTSFEVESFVNFPSVKRVTFKHEKGCYSCITMLSQDPYYLKLMEEYNYAKRN